MTANPKRISGPDVEPITVDEVKLHLKIDHTDDDVYIAALVHAARVFCEQWTGRAFTNQTWKLTLQQWPTRYRSDQWWDGPRLGAMSELHHDADRVPLPKGEIQSITSVVTYDDSDADTTWGAENYRLTADGELARKEGVTWPTALRASDAIEITYIAGYGEDWNAVPMALRQGLTMLVSHWYENRAPVNIGNITTQLPLSVGAALGQFKIMRLA